ncbi:MAG: hypothetical protein ACNA77_05335 [Opitutales bacterium]
MLNATLKSSFLILMIVTLASLAGCSNPEERRAEQIKVSYQLTEAGAFGEAIEILEALLIDYPNDPQILAAMGRIYSQLGEHTTAAFFLEQAYAQEPENIELLYQSYQAKQAAGEATGALLEKLAARSNESMTKALWLELGQHRAEINQIESALEAYLKGVDPDQSTPAPETAAAIGKLFAKLNNQAQAASWFELAADSDSPAALTALFGLLQIQINQKNWPGAEATIVRTNKQFPGALQASEWKQASDEIMQWRAKQEAMKAKLAAEKAAKDAAEAAAKEQTETADETESTETEIAVHSEEPGGEGGKSQVVADLAAAEAMANQPALETASPDETGASPITFNPNIAITPAEPDWSIAVSFDEESIAPETTYNIEGEREPATEATEPDPIATAEAITPVIGPPQPPKTLEELLAEAEAAEVDRDYKSAIRKYWAAISITNNRAEIWNLLSRAYLIDGQLKNAETTALEAVRLAPREVAYTLDFLRVAQRSRPPQEFLAQLETAYDRFPTSPEITLSLARAHERISQDQFVARNLYLRFIDIAPNHPLVPEARAAAARLR